MKRLLISAALAAIVTACGETPADEAAKPAPDTEAAEVAPADDAADAAADLETAVDGADRSLDAVLAAQPEENQARYQFRHPKETLEFIGVEPGMTVIDVLPGGGYYTRILMPYLGDEGTVIGVDYAKSMWALFGGFANEEFLAAKDTWTQTWTAQAEEWRGDGDAAVTAAVFGAMPESAAGAVDAALVVRAYHHLARFEEEGGFESSALADLFTALKPGGVVGIVQHRAPESNDDVWAEGDNGYVKESDVKAAMEAAGFEFVEASEINANPKDQPTNEDVVWRLPPALATSREDAALREQMTAIGESDRMTLKFRKPA
ncbi:MAG: methyltransferase [Pseudomonadota bacterium]